MEKLDNHHLNHMGAWHDLPEKSIAIQTITLFPSCPLLFCCHQISAAIDLLRVVSRPIRGAVSRPIRTVCWSRESKESNHKGIRIMTLVPRRRSQTTSCPDKYELSNGPASKESRHKGCRVQTNKNDNTGPTSKESKHTNGETMMMLSMYCLPIVITVVGVVPAPLVHSVSKTQQSH